MEDILPGITSPEKENKNLEEEGFDQASKEYLAWELETELNIPVPDDDIAKWETPVDIYASIK